MSVDFVLDSPRNRKYYLNFKDVQFFADFHQILQEAR